MRGAILVLVGALAACAFNPPGQCLATSDCPAGTECTAGVCAGNGEGVVNTDAGSGAGPNCTLVPPGVPASADLISVNGKGGPFGIVAYSVYGISDGGSLISGFEHVTSGTVVGTPAALIQDTGLWARNSTALSAGQTITGGNSGAFPKIDFIITPKDTSAPAADCPPGAGTGSASFTLVEYPGDGGLSSGIQGSFRFQCPDAGIDVTGCFRYPK